MTYTKLADGRIIDYSHTKIMGIINVTSDSFYEGSRTDSVSAALKKAEKFLSEGADILDVGGESTRPGADEVDADEEICRVEPVISAIKKEFPNSIISIDTYKAKTAEAAINSGADIVNDISGMRFDPDMAGVVLKHKVPVVIMHVQGTPKNMQKNPVYVDVVAELIEYFKERIEFAEKLGISKEKIIIDPGFGFGKKVEHNIEILKRLKEFHSLNLPVLLGVSRKASIGKITGADSPDERLEGTLAVTAKAVLDGIEIIRVHDVIENFRVVKMIEAIR